MEELTKEAEAKLQMLRYTNGKTRGIVEKGNLGAVARHRDNLQALVKEVDALKLRVEQRLLIVHELLVKFVDRHRLCSCNDKQICDVLDLRIYDLTRFPIFAD